MPIPFLRPVAEDTFLSNVALEALRVVNQCLRFLANPTKLLDLVEAIDTSHPLMKSGKSHGLAKPHDLHRTDLPHREALR